MGRTAASREVSCGLARPMVDDVIVDSRTRPGHLAMDGVIRPVRDPLWKRWTPPCGHRCRCTLRQVSAREAQRRCHESA
jgi:uncharacterized protein with gpF-like domain